MLGNIAYVEPKNVTVTVTQTNAPAPANITASSGRRRLHNALITAHSDAEMQYHASFTGKLTLREVKALCGATQHTGLDFTLHFGMGGQSHAYTARLSTLSHCPAFKPIRVTNAPVVTAVQGSGGVQFEFKGGVFHSGEFKCATHIIYEDKGDACTFTGSATFTTTAAFSCRRDGEGGAVWHCPAGATHDSNSHCGGKDYRCNVHGKLQDSASAR